MLFAFRISIAIALGVVASACAPTLSPEERTAACSTTDWRLFGENDGLLGVATADRAEKFLDCEELGYPVDMVAYQEGRKVGLESYCTVEVGYQVGYDGRPYDDVCPPETEQAFLQGLERGSRDRPPAVYSPRYGYGIGSGARVGVGSGVSVGVGIGF